MSVPSRKLEVSEILGYHLYWFLESNVPRAIQGGYEFVEATEVTLNQQGVATSRSVSGNVDLGGQVKVVAGASERGGAEHLVLMKIKKEYYDADREAIEKGNERVLEAIFRGETIGNGKGTAADVGKTYLKEALFQRPSRKGA